MSAPVYTLLINNTAVAALVGTRVFPAGIIPQDVTDRPAIAYQTVGGTPLNLLGGGARGDNERVMIDCWDYTLAGAQALAAAVRAALDDLSALQAAGVACECKSFNGNDFEPQTKTFRESNDFSFWSA